MMICYVDGLQYFHHRSFVQFFFLLAVRSRKITINDTLMDNNNKTLPKKWEVGFEAKRMTKGGKYFTFHCLMLFIRKMFFFSVWTKRSKNG